MNAQKLVESKLAGKTEALEENQLYCHTVHHKSHMTWPGIEQSPSCTDTLFGGSRNLKNLMEQKGPLLCSRQPSNGPPTKPSQYNLF
jgi:hypothetical protein